MQNDLEKLKEKIEYDFEKFYLSATHTSKDNIFAVSKEIEIKKSIRRYVLSILNSLQALDITFMLAENNLLEAIYQKVECDFPERAIPESVIMGGIHKILGNPPDKEREGYKN